MPFINIQTLPLPESVDQADVTIAVVQALAEAISTPAEKIFAGWSFFAVQADGPRIESTFQSASHPPIVSIDMFQGRTKEQKVAALESIAKTLKERLDFAGNPFVFIRDIANAQVTTGGNVIDRS